MAKTNKRKTPSQTQAKKNATGTAARGNKSSSATKSRAATTADRHPAKATKKAKTGTGTKTQKSTAASRSPEEDAQNKGKASDAQMVKRAKSTFFSEQYLPYILGAIGLLLGVLMVLNAIGAPRSPGQSHAGWLGYYICYGFFGVMGWTAAAIPVLLVVLAVMWRKYSREGILVLNSVLSAVLMIFVSAVIHVFVHRDTYHPMADLFHSGATYQSGGVIGGFLGYWLGYALGVYGTLALALVTLPFIVMCLAGVTPAYVFSCFRKSVRESRERRAEARAERERREEQLTVEREEREARRRRIKTASMDDGEDDGSEDDVTPSKHKEKKSKKERSEDDRRDDRRSDDRRSDDRGDDRRSDDRRMLLIDPDTGEVVRDGEPVGADVTDATTPDESPDGQGSDRPPRSADNILPFDDTVSVPDTDPAESTAEPSYGYAEHTAAEDLPPVPTDTMEVDFSDDPEDLPFDTEGTRRTGRSGSVRYTVESDDGEDESPIDDMPTTTVRILKSDTSAIVEQGLAEEEVVISSATGEEIAPAPEYQFPPIDILTRGSSRYEADEAEIAENTRTLRAVLESFRIGIREISCSCGPTITRFEVKPEAGIRVRSIANLVDDIAMGLAKSGVRIEAPIPGKAAVGIEVPNAHAATVYLRNLIETPEFQNHKSRLAACLGADVSGRPVIMDIYKMPHLLIAGATGMGKSVCINSIIMSILYKAKPDEVKLILIDPKKVEFTMYRDLPHLYAPIVSDPKKAAGALNSAVNEMERRFELIEEVGVRNIAGYNEVTAGDPERPPMPQMVIIIDELADLMMTAPSEVETAICRLAQKARAAGIHLIIGTQRPSVDVITGLIKANVPSRIAFTVASQIDSRTIIDTVGADKLIGRGDMLFAPVGATKPMRAQGAFVSDSEVERVVTFIKEHNEKAHYDEEFTNQIEIEAAKCAAGKKKGGEQLSLDDFDGLGGNDGEDSKFWDAVEVAINEGKVSTSMFQRRLKLGYGRAAKIIDQMEEMGIVGPADGNKPRKLLITKQDYMEMRMNGRAPGASNPADDDSDDDFAGL